jgi:hypothetical protein
MDHSKQAKVVKVKVSGGIVAEYLVLIYDKEKSYKSIYTSYLALVRNEVRSLNRKNTMICTWKSDIKKYEQ